MNYKSGIWLIFLLFGLSCSIQKEEKNIIAISWYYPNNDYQNWVSSVDTQFQFVELYSVHYDSIVPILERASGLILTGGPDISAIQLGIADSLSLCGKPNPKRDSVELLAASFALSNDIPTLGVCRGLQILNTASSGSLILDIPSYVNSNIHQKPDTDAEHYVYAASDFFTLKFGLDSGWTNSNHHQAIKKLGKGWIIDAITKDSIIEAIHYSDTIAHPFLRAVQWHPERMPRESAMSKNLIVDFISHINQ